MSPPQQSNLSSQKEPQTLTVDSLVRAVFGILQVIVLAASGWMFTQILDHGDRITRVELRTETNERVAVQTAELLKEIGNRQQTILQMFAELKPELARVKIDLSTLMERLESLTKK